MTDRIVQGTELGSSVSIEETAKGPRVTVKVRVPDSEEAVRAAQRIALDMYAETISWLIERGLRAA